MMHKLLIICPTYGNTTEAICAHTQKMIDRFSRKKTISVLTSRDYLPTFNLGISDINVITIDGKWNIFNLIRRWKDIKKFAPDFIFVQYVPFLYGRGGINFSLPFFCLILRIFTGAKLEIYFHELYYPMEAKIKSMIMHVCHMIMLFLLGHLGHRVFTTTEEFRKILTSLLVFQKKISCVPVGSNLEKIPIDQNQIQTFKEKYKINKDEFVLGSFGTFHPSKNYRLIFEIICKLKSEIETPIRFIMVGQSLEDLKVYLGEELWSKLEGIVIAPGKMNDREINIAMNVMNIYIGYFVDGLSSRRGSLIAALQAGLPVISTFTQNTDIVFFNQEDIYLFPTDEKLFKASVISLLKDKMNYFKTNNKINHTLYDDYFNWDVIMEKFERFEGEKR